MVNTNFVDLESLVLHAKFHVHRTSGSGEEEFSLSAHVHILRTLDQYLKANNWR